MFCIYFVYIMTILYIFCWQLHDKINEAIDKSLRSNVPQLHKLHIRRPIIRHRPKAIKLSNRMPISAQSQDPKTLDRMQLELYNHFEHYGTSVQERSDLLRVLTHEQASLQGIKYASAKGLKSFVEKDNFSDVALEVDLWKGILSINLIHFCLWIVQTM